MKTTKAITGLMLATSLAISVNAELTAIDIDTTLPESVLLNNSVISEGYSKVFSGKSKGQSFTLNTASQISGLILKLDTVTTVGDLTLEFYNADANGLPTGSPIYSGTTTVPAGMNDLDFLQLNFPALSLDAGAYAFSLSSSNANITIDTNTSYPSHNLIVQNNNDPWFDTGAASGEKDLSFALIGVEDSLELTIATTLPNDLVINNFNSEISGQTVVSTSNDKGQSFTIEQGAKVSSIIVETKSTNAASDITLSLYNATNNLPTGEAIYTKTTQIPAGVISGSMLQFSFPELTLQPGSYSFTLTGDGLDLAFKTNNDYASGSIIRKNSATNNSWAQTGNGATDMKFAIGGTVDELPPVVSNGPNIIHILVDDMSYTDHNVDSLVRYQNELSDFIETPNIATLASEGVSFTWSYTQPNCAPSRAAFMSGQYSARSGNGVYNVDSLKRSGSRTTYLNVIEQGQNDGDGVNSGDDYISGVEGSVPLAQALLDQGYTTVHFGKYHVGDRNAANITHPLNQGFQYNYGGNEKGNPGNYFASGTPRTWGSNVGPELDAYAADYTQEYIDAHIAPFENGNDSSTLLGTQKHLTDAMADAFEDFMNQHRAGANAAKPVYAQLHFYGTHSPIQGRPDLVAKYANKKALGASPTADTSNGFAALAENMDHSVARVMRYLSDPNLDGDTSDSIAENTLVIWTTDNGGSEPYSENTPLRGAKGQNLEGGIRVPMIIRMPGTIPADRISESMVHAIDMYPTILDFANGQANTPNPNAETHKLDGTSLYAHLLDPDNVTRDRGAIFYHFPGYMDNRAYASSTVIKEINNVRYKYIYNYDTYYGTVKTYAQRPDQFQLYDLTNDPYESVNLMDYIDIENPNDANDPSTAEEYQNYLDYKAIASELSSDLRNWLIGEEGDTSWSPLFPTYKQNFADASPVIDDADVGQPVALPPAAMPEL